MGAEVFHTQNLAVCMTIYLFHAVSYPHCAAVKGLHALKFKGKYLPVLGQPVALVYAKHTPRCHNYVRATNYL